MVITKSDIKNLEKVTRLKLINSICGIRSVHLIGTFSNTNTNLAIFSSVTHLGSNPALFSFISRPDNIVRRDTLANIKKHKYYTINSVENDMLNNAHQTSCKYDKDESEFDACSFQEKYINDFSAPFVATSSIKIGMKLIDLINIKHNQTVMVVGEVQVIHMKSRELNENFKNSIGVIGLNSYYGLNSIKTLKYCRLNK
jgi:flavin reductase (DIM6/NTAB) family NADH-FMN oxidoreductase RutF